MGPLHGAAAADCRGDRELAVFRLKYAYDHLRSEVLLLFEEEDAFIAPHTS